MPSCAVTTTEMDVVLPSANARPPDACPEFTATLFTLMVAIERVAVGVSVIEATLLATVIVYDVVDDANAGAKVPVLGTRLIRVEIADGARLTTTL